MSPARQLNILSFQDTDQVSPHTNPKSLPCEDDMW
jgi:hypothetical protein